MPCAVSYIGPIIFVRWRDDVQLSDVLVIEAEVKKQRARVGEPLTVAWIVPATVALLASEARPAFGRAIHGMRHNFQAIHVVIEGSGFVNAAYRSIFTPSRATNDQGPVPALHESVDDCLREIARAYNVDVAALVKTATFQGVLLP